MSHFHVDLYIDARDSLDLDLLEVSMTFHENLEDVFTSRFKALRGVLRTGKSSLR